MSISSQPISHWMGGESGHNALNLKGNHRSMVRGSFNLSFSITKLFPLFWHFSRYHLAVETPETQGLYLAKSISPTVWWPDCCCGAPFRDQSRINVCFLAFPWHMTGLWDRMERTPREQVQNKTKYLRQHSMRKRLINIETGLPYQLNNVSWHLETYGHCGID